MTILNTESSGNHFAGQVTADSANHAYDQVVEHIKNTAPLEIYNCGDLSDETIDTEWNIGLSHAVKQLDDNDITFYFRATAPD